MLQLELSYNKRTCSMTRKDMTWLRTNMSENKCDVIGILSETNSLKIQLVSRFLS